VATRKDLTIGRRFGVLVEPKINMFRPMVVVEK